MDSWENVWRNGVVPQLSVTALEALRDALVGDDPRLLQGATTVPPPLQCVLDWPVEKTCLLGLCAWSEIEKSYNGHIVTVGEIEEGFAGMCFRADQLLGEAGGIRWLLNSYDEWDRDEMRRLLLPEVESAIEQKYIDIERVTDECRSSTIPATLSLE